MQHVINAALASLAADGFVLLTPEQVAFLRGEKPWPEHEHVWFGDRHPAHAGAFWWRSVLFAAATAGADASSGDAKEPGT